jgi:hypothetical protein
VPRSRSVQRLRVLAAFLIAGAGVAAAVWLHGYTTSQLATIFDDPNCSGYACSSSPGYFYTHPSWADPVAVFVAFAALGVGAMLLLWRRKTA